MPGTPGSTGGWGNRGGRGGRWGGGFNRTVNVFDYGYVWPMQPIVAIETPVAETPEKVVKKTDSVSTSTIITIAIVALCGVAMYKLLKS